MARNTMHFAQQNTAQAMQATNWVREIAEQNLNQSKAALEGFLTIARNAACSIDLQSSTICEPNRCSQMRSCVLARSFM